jgi:hypothetical protein
METARSPIDRRRRRRRLHAPAATAGVAILAGLVLSVGLSPAGSPEPTPPTSPRPVEPQRRPSAEPIWVPTPVKIDRAREQRHRIVDPEDGQPRIEGRGGVPAPDGSFAVGAVRGRLPALILPDRQKLCTGTTGARWACGIRAHATLSGFVTGQDLACRPINETAVAGMVRDLADCRSRGRSLIETMVGNGWAEVDPRLAEPAIVRLGARAIEAKRGLWSDEPPR